MTKSIREEARTWFRKNWSSALVLVLIFILALYLRSYFAYDLATETGFVVSGGSDSYYHKRVIDYVVDTGHHLVEEPLLGYPFGSQASGRPPLFDWSVAVSGMAIAPLFANVDTSVWYSFIFSTAIWGALTVFPMYFLAKGAFGRKAGMLAAFLLAIMPAHIQRSPLTNGDHDAYILFFVVTTFFFFMKALGALQERKWVRNWLRLKDIRRGFSEFFTSNRDPVLYSFMAAISLTAIALAWKGFGYVVVILLLYFFFQILLNKFRNVDSTGVLVCFAITVGVALILSIPWYIHFLKIADFSTPAYMFIGGLIFGVIFVVTRDYPWSLVLPSVFTVAGLALFIMFIYAPGTVSTFLAGAGYFIRTKAYETIAEAQPPTFSQQAMSFGAVTYFLALFGLIWAAVQLPKRLKPDYLFIIVWTGAAIFMAMSAARFIFNGGPAFAAASAWVIVSLVDRLDFKSAKKVYDSLSGSKLHALRRAIKVRHVAGVLFIAFLVVMPNVWYGVDAAIPFEDKRRLDTEIYEATPYFMQPEHYNPPWFLGAFGYSLPLNNRYWPAAWDWLEQQDADILPYEDRPAFLSWWDYGFEAVQQGKHPTVADNFLHGFPTAGNFIAAQDENTAIAYLSIQLLQGDYADNDGRLGPDTRSILEKYGLNPDEVETVIRYPTIYVDEILRDPDRFGPRDDAIQAQNALLIYLKQLFIEQHGTDTQAEMYMDICGATGKSIRYFAVDSRMFPFSGGNPGIFYAPMKLSDHRIKDYDVRSDVPIDFFDLRCIVGGSNLDCDEVTAAQAVSDFEIVYQPMFWNSMFYRTYVGYSAVDLGEDPREKGIPGLSGEYANLQPMHGWGLQHFKMVYRTAYYNPYPPGEYQNHTEAWTAVNIDDALRYQQEIQMGVRQGVVDTSPRAGLSTGVVFLKYYHGAIVTGSVTVDGETPLSGVRVTVKDEYDVPHYVSYTDDDGGYEVLVPFGEIKIVASTGTMNNMTMTGETVLNSTTISVTDEQAMRVPIDTDGDGKLDYYLENDIVVDGGELTGFVFIDLDDNSNMDSDEPRFASSQILLRSKVIKEEIVTATDENGFYKASGALQGDYDLIVTGLGRSIGPYEVNVTAGETTARNIPVKPGGVKGLTKFEDGSPMEGATLVLLDESNGTETVKISGRNGVFEFGTLLPGNFTLTAVKGEYGSLPLRFKLLSEGETRQRNMTLNPAGEVTGRSRVLGDAVPGVTALFRSLRRQTFDVFVVTDKGGFYSVDLPEGGYLVFALHDLNGQKFVHMSKLIVRRDEVSLYDIGLEMGVEVSGIVSDKASGIPQNQIRVTFDGGDARITVVTSKDGHYSQYLPIGEYSIWVSQQNFAYLEEKQITDDTSLDIALDNGILVVDTIFEDRNLNDQYDTGEGIEDVEVAIENPTGATMRLLTDGSGGFTATIMGNAQYRIFLSKGGYSSEQLGPMSATDLSGLAVLQLTSLPVSLQGAVTIDGEPFTSQTLSIRFESLGEGAVSDETPTYQGEYQLALRPGKYEVVIDAPVGSSPTERYQLLQPTEIDLEPTGWPVKADLPITRRFQVSGTTTLDGVGVAANITFSGTEEKQVDLENGSFSIFLMEGMYTLIATTSTNDTEYMSVASFTVPSPTPLDIRLHANTQVSGRVFHEGQEFLETLYVNFSSEIGGLVESANTTAAMYSVNLPPGTYGVEVDQTGTVTIEGLLKYVRYVFSDTLVIAEGVSEKTFDIHLLRIFDNVTLTGNVLYNGEGVDAVATLTATSETAFNTTFQSQDDGSFNLSIAPGGYAAYVHRKAGHLVYLGVVVVERVESNHFEFNLMESHRVSGHASYRDGLRKTTFMTAFGNATYSFYSNDEGYFEVYVPPGIYQISGVATDLEDGKTTTYSGSQDLEIDGDKTISLSLEKDVHRQVILTWSASERREIAGGESVNYRISIENAGNAPDSFELTGLPPRDGWTFQFSPQEISLGTGEEAFGSFEVTITAPTDALVEHGPLKILATSVNDPNANDEEIVEVEIERQWGVELGLYSDLDSYDGLHLDMNVNVTNPGNDADSYHIEIVNLEEIEADGWQIGLRNETSHQTTSSIDDFQVGAKSVSKFGVRLTPPGKSTVKTVVLYAYSHDNRGNDALISFDVVPPATEVLEDQIFAGGRDAQREPAEDYVDYLLVGVVSAGLVAVFMFIRRRRK